MLEHRRKISILCAAISLLIGISALAQTSTRTSLGLYGGNFLDVAVDPTGAFYLGAVNGPNGVYYSLDGGSNWSLASGGAYQTGKGNYVAVSSSKAYVTTQAPAQLLVAALPSSGASSWSPNWSNITGVTNPDQIMLGSHALYVGGTSSSSLTAIDLTTDSVLQSSSPSGSMTSVASMSASSTAIYVVGNQPSGAGFFTASINTDGTLGTWSDLSAFLPTGSTATRVLALSDDTVYVGVTGTSSGVYKKASTSTAFALVSALANSSATSACASSDGLYINIGLKLSVDGGISWQTLGIVNGPNSTQIRIEEDQRNGICVFDPIDKNKFIKRTTRGLAKTSDISNPSTAVWNELYTGVEAVTAYSMGQNPSAKNRVCLGSNSGISVSDDFTTGSPPSWTFICPGNDCVGGRNVVMSPVSTSQCLVGSGQIYGVTISGSGSSLSLSSSVFLNKPDNSFSYSSLVWPSFLSTTVIAGYRNDSGTDGGLYFYDTGSQSVTNTLFGGKSVSAFVALNASTMYAGLGASTEASPSSTTRGMYKSTDGGTNFSAVTDSVISTDPLLLVNKFAYDSTHDVLFAVSNSSGATDGKVFRLKNALAGGTWEAASPTFPSLTGTASFSVLAVDETTGTVYTGSNAQVWESSDDGDTWTLTFSAGPGEDIQMLFFDALNSGTSNGLQKVVAASTPAATPTATASPTPTPQCGISSSCKKFGKSKKCTMSFSDRFGAATGTLQKKASVSGKWAKLKAFYTPKSGKTKLTLVVTKSTFYRAILKKASTSCTTDEVLVTVSR